MAQSYASGAMTAVKYDYETSFGTGGTPTYPFGYGCKVTVNRNNNFEKIYGVGSRNSAFTIAKKFQGTMTMDFIMGHAYWLKAIVGTQGSAGGAGPYTHAFTESNTPVSMIVALSTDLGTNDMVTTYTGVVVNSCKISLAVDEAVKVSLECLYKTESTAFTGTFSQPSMDDAYNGTGNIWDALTFAHGSITYAGQSMGNTYSGQVQTCELTINNNLDLLWGVGSRLGQERINKKREYNLRLNYALVSVANSADVFENMMGDTSTPIIPATGNITGVDMVMAISNAGATTALRSLVFTFTSAKTFINSSAMTFDINEILKDNVEGWAESISSIVWTDNSNSGIGA